MYASNNLIHSKRVFRLQMFTHSVSKLSLELDTQISTSIISCHENIARILTSYDEHWKLLDQISAYEQLALQIARFSALVEQLSPALNIYPGIDPIVIFSEELFFDIQYVSAKKRNHLHMLTFYLSDKSCRFVNQKNDFKYGIDSDKNNDLN